MAQSSDQIGMNTSWSSAAPSLTAKASGHKVAVVLPLHGCGFSANAWSFRKIDFSRDFPTAPHDGSEPTAVHSFCGSAAKLCDFASFPSEQKLIAKK